MIEWRDPARTIAGLTADQATEWAAFVLILLLALLVVTVWSRRTRLMSWPGMATYATGMAVIGFRIYIGRRLDLAPSWWGVSIWLTGLVLMIGGMAAIWWRRPPSRP